MLNHRSNAKCLNLLLFVTQLRFSSPLSFLLLAVIFVLGVQRLPPTPLKAPRVKYINFNQEWPLSSKHQRNFLLHARK